MASAPRDTRYELGLLVLLTLANGVVAFDRLTVAFLAPYIVADLHLSNAQVGWLAGALSGAIALSAFFGGRLADRSGKRKAILIACTVLFSIGSGAGGLAMSFAMLFAARFLLGVAEGPMVPVSQTVMAETSAPERRGMNMGIMQMVGAFGLGAMLGPIVATQIAETQGWRVALFLSAAPGLVLAAIMFLFMKRDVPPPASVSRETGSVLEALTALLRIPNMRASLGVAALFTAWLVLQNTFLALYLTEVKGLSPTAMGGVLSMGGLAGIIGGVGLPFLSDRIGRKPVVVGATLAGIACPVALLALPGDPLLLGGAILLGWLPLGIAPLYCATIPTESVSPAMATTAVGLSMGTAELIGGVAAPALAGPVADAYGLASVLYICIALALAAAMVALFLKETAPCIVGAPVKA
ncbi:MAG: MFS transporter [Sphingomonadaceae bacterium]|nr:MFS transporter [Sphingomonadaceae bacterium]